MSPPERQDEVHSQNYSFHHASNSVSHPFIQYSFGRVFDIEIGGVAGSFTRQTMTETSRSEIHLSFAVDLLLLGITFSLGVFVV